MVFGLFTETNPAKDAQKRADAHQQELAREIEAAVKGDVAALETTLAALTNEQTALLDAYDSLKANHLRDPQRHGPAMDAWWQRKRDLPVVIATVNRRLDVLKAEASAKTLTAWSKDASTKRLYVEYIHHEAGLLEHVASLMNERDRVAREAGADPRTLPLPPAPADQQQRLSGLVEFIRTCRRAGMSIDLKATPAVAARCEAK